MVKLAELTHCNAKEVERLIAEGADVNGADEFSRTALIHAAINDNVAVMKVLVDKGADIERVGENDWTPLMRAADCGSLKAVHFLLKKGADWRKKNASGRSALDIVTEIQVIGTTRHNGPRKAEKHEELKRLFASWAATAADPSPIRSLKDTQTHVPTEPRSGQPAHKRKHHGKHHSPRTAPDQEHHGEKHHEKGHEHHRQHHGEGKDGSEAKHTSKNA